MEIPKQNINYEISDLNINPKNPNINVYYSGYTGYTFYVSISILCILIFVMYRWMKEETIGNFLVLIERKITEFKESFILFMNKWLLQINMDGNAIKTTHPASYNSLSKIDFLDKWT